MPTITAEKLRQIAIDIFMAVGVPKNEARLVAEHLVEANLAGVDSHGVIRIPRYVRRIQQGRIRPGADIQVVRETSTTALINGNWGFGQVIALKAMNLAIKKAEEHGVGIVGVFNCNHIGRLAHYSTLALKHNMIGIILCNGPPLVAPFGGMDRILNTGPISVAVPAGREGPIVMDISTSVSSEGKIRTKRNMGKLVPDGWLLDKDGRPTNDPNALYEGGVILPLGGNVGYKGYALGLVVDVLGGALTGAGCASSEEYKGGNGVFIMVLNVANFTSVQDFKKRVDTLIRTIKTSRVAPGFNRILIPGEPEIQESIRRSKEGIPIDDETWRSITEIAKEVGVSISNQG